MPYKSEKQRGYLHARHPEIAAQWDAEIRSKKKGKIQKAARESLGMKIAGAGVDVGQNLLATGPKAREEARRQRRRLRKLKGRVKKAYEPATTDPYFNHRAAERAFNLVMKMDDDTAAMFTTIVVGEALEDDIANNLETIQKALNVTFEKRLDAVKKALVRTAQTSSDPQVLEFAKQVRRIEEFAKAAHTPQYYGYDWDPSDFRRDPGTGRFMVKVKHTMSKPLDEKQAQAVIGDHGPAHLNTAQRAQYQDEYRQVASFLQGVAGTGQPGDMNVVYHLRDRAGNNFSRVSNQTDVPKDLLGDPNTQLVAMEAKPTTLTAGGAAYGLLGGMTPDQTSRVNQTFGPKTEDSLAGKFASGWDTAGTTGEQNRRLFDRLNASGSFLNSAMAPGSKLQLAGKFAQVVGQYGPEAEKVIGPSARKTAYRYRGTEKAPEDTLVSTYGREIQDAKKYGVSEADADKRLLGFGTRREQARGDFTSMGSRRPTGAREIRREVAVPSIHQMGQDRAGEAQMMMREPSWGERGAGSAIVADYLRRKLPDKHLYKLHVAAGNTPPSEGVIINSEGQLAAQAVGYGDDHYLPFNLKNLGALKGGEYIRNRSMGGLTAEDVYAGLVTGARRITVVSRSGTFSMEFEPDFRGGRRHNDKAKRMTARYEQLLDAVQSGQVDRQQIPKMWKDAIKQEVLEDEYYKNAPKSVQQDEVAARLDEFKNNPKIEGRDEDRAELLASRMEERAAKGEIPEQDAKDFRTQVFNELYNMKEVRFRLNGLGYEAALKSLQEQFPYYIKDVKTRPTRDEELLEFGLDEGYVEPGRNRPTRANAGYYGTKENAADQTGFMSASQADYQRGKRGKGGFKQAEQAEAGTPQNAANKVVDPKDKARQTINDRLAREGAVTKATDAAVKIRQNIKMGVGDDNFVGGKKPPFIDMDDDRFREWLNDKPENEKAFNQFLEDNAELWSKEGEGGIGGFPHAYEQYKQTRGRIHPNPYSKDKAGVLPSIPYTFDHKTENAYHAGARPHEIEKELSDLNRKTTLLTSRKNLSELTDAEMRTEIDRFMSLKRGIQQDGLSVDDVLAAHRGMTPDAPDAGRLKPIFKDEASMDEHLEKIHQARYLNDMKKSSARPPTPRPAANKGPTKPEGGEPEKKPEPEPKAPDDASSITVDIADDPQALREGAARASSELGAAKAKDSGMGEGDRQAAWKDHDAVEDLHDAITSGNYSHSEVRDMYNALTDRQKDWVTGKRYYRNRKLSTS